MCLPQQQGLLLADGIWDFTSFWKHCLDWLVAITMFREI